MILNISFCMTIIHFDTIHCKIITIFVPFIALILITSTFLNRDILVSEQGLTDKCTCRNRVFCCWWIIAKKTDIALFDAKFLADIPLTYHTIVKWRFLLTYWPLLRSKNKIYIIEYMSRFGTGSSTRRRTASTGSVPPQCYSAPRTTSWFILASLVYVTRFARNLAPPPPLPNPGSAPAWRDTSKENMVRMASVHVSYFPYVCLICF